MAAYAFYHLLRRAPEEALPALLGRTLGAGHRAAVWCGDPNRVKALDAALWKVSDPVWLPHAATGAEYPERQPVWLTGGEDVPNGAEFLFLMDGRRLPHNSSFSRIFDLFDGQDGQAVADARSRWTEARAAGHELAYWRQEEKGWVRAK
ncbi:DNA polymerase III subunit chi [Acetobacter sp. AN02]|uniref:DNA polymerase III subunit chi n=1 Tax=Acetobacter sp. AN02 TaxID=2894186 RepID=UPI0024341E13|nr:DNA polymerase III subunit chi [Acetobacter sp. AN02]MDG6095526.1 DNA polymerase III subunit chi [Acetobacter sp. AN02]